MNRLRVYVTLTVICGLFLLSGNRAEAQKGNRQSPGEGAAKGKDIPPAQAERADVKGHPSGTLIGYTHASGLFAFSFSSKKMRPLLARRVRIFADRLEKPAFDAQSNTLFYADLKHQEIRLWQSGAASPQKLWRIPDSYDVSWTLLTPDKSRLLICTDRTNVDERLYSFDRKTSKTTLVMKDFIWLGSRPDWINASEFLVIARKRVIRGKASWHLVRVNPKSKKVSPVFRNQDCGRFALSASGTRLCIDTDEGDYLIYEFPSLKRLRRITSNELPGTTSGGRLCFAGDRYLVIYRDRGVWQPLGTYVVNVETGASRRAFRGQLLGAIYLPGILRWQAP